MATRVDPLDGREDCLTRSKCEDMEQYQTRNQIAFYDLHLSRAKSKLFELT